MTMKKHPELILPPKAILPPPPTTLDEAKKRIHANIKDIEAAADAIRKRAVEIGRDLIVVKSFIAKHGDFLEYVQAEFQMQPRTAQRYMRVSEFIEVNPDMMQEGVALSALYAVIDANLAPEVLESIKTGLLKGSIPKTGAGVKKAIAAKSASTVVKAEKANAAAGQKVLDDPVGAFTGTLVQYLPISIIAALAAHAEVAGWHDLAAALKAVGHG